MSELRKIWECPDCCFGFDAMHTDPGGGYSCPECEVGQLRATNAAWVKATGWANPEEAGKGVNGLAGDVVGLTVRCDALLEALKTVEPYLTDLLPDVANQVSAALGISPLAEDC
jgi:hypothetical protein